ncbi:hypothetical protein [Algibacter aquimarinus]
MNKKLYIQNELSQIDTLLNHNLYDVKTSFIGESTNSYTPKIDILAKIFSTIKYGWDTFTSSYEQYFFNEKENDFIPFKKDKDITQEQLDSFNERHIKYHKQGSEFAKYVLWLKKGENKSELIKRNTSELSHKQKMLILYYLGLDILEHDKTSMSKLLFHLLELNEDNTRKYLSYVANGKNEVRTEKNLTKVKLLFEKFGFLGLSNTIQKDIDMLK